MLNFQLGFSILLYSKNAKNQLNKTTPINGRCSNQLNCCFIFKCPYQAHVIKILDATNNRIV